MHKKCHRLVKRKCFVEPSLTPLFPDNIPSSAIPSVQTIIPASPELPQGHHDVGVEAETPKASLKSIIVLPRDVVSIKAYIKI